MRITCQAIDLAYYQLKAAEIVDEEADESKGCKKILGAKLLVQSLRTIVSNKAPRECSGASTYHSSLRQLQLLWMNLFSAGMREFLLEHFKRFYSLTWSSKSKASPSLT